MPSPSVPEPPGSEPSGSDSGGRDPAGRRARDRLPSWAGAPGFSPYPDTGMPHAPMPGAPPYPPAVAPPPVAPRAPGPGNGRAFAVAGTWAAAGLVLMFVLGGVPTGAELGVILLSLAAPTLLTALAVRVVARGRAWSFWLLLLVAAPFFWVLRALQNLLVG